MKTPTQDGWTSEPPTVAGVYEWRKISNANHHSVIRIEESALYNGLAGCRADFGSRWHPVSHFDGGLWRRLVPAVESPYSEVPCCECKERMVEFGVPNALWNSVMRPDGREHDREYLCITCFCEKLGRMVPKVEVERAYREGYDDGDIYDESQWHNSRAKKVMEGTEQ